MTSKRLILLDGHALLFRAFHAMPPFTAPDGRPSGAVYGFANVLVRVIKELEPTWVVACFDAPGPTFREEVYKDYKATRAETPPDIIIQEPMTKEVVEAFGIPHMAVSGWEADDLIATLVDQGLRKSELLPCRQAGRTPALPAGRPKSETDVEEIIVVTGDRDLLQLSQPKVKIYLLRNGTKEIVLLDEVAVTDLIGLPPDQLLDWKALRGDPSDNIIGVPGVGDKTALQLIKAYVNLEGLYAELEIPNDEFRMTNEKSIQNSEFVIRNSIRESLLMYRERAFANRDLLTVRTDAPVTLDLAAAHRRNYEPARARAALVDLGFKGILSRLPTAMVANQPNLFDK
ncbi:MAG: 5'-3' exonuclease H3TH domain-containing protein [Patescibacteria group bacterium]